MSKEQARQAVLSEYDSWAKQHPNQASMMGGFLFFRYLQTDKSDLLDFRAASNKWPIVHAGFKIGCKISALLTGRFLPNARGRLGEAASSSFTGCERPRGSGDEDGRLSLLVNRTAVSNDLN